VGSTCQWEGERAGYPFGVRGVAGLGQNGGWARKVPRGPFLFLTSFLILLFCFAISFIVFAIKLQIKSNQFLNHSTTQGDILKQ
jgi:hypothetical protein